MKIKYYLFILILIFGQSLKAQTLLDSCLTDSLPVLTIASQWKITSNSLSAPSNVPSTQCTYQYLNLPAFPIAKWISCIPSWTIYAYATNPDDSISFRKEFRLCHYDTVHLKFTVKRDNYCTVYIDGLILLKDPVIWDPNFHDIGTLIDTVLYLSAGIHQLDITDYNRNSYTGINGFGLLVGGFMKSNNPTIIRDSSACSNVSCCVIPTYSILGDTVLCYGESTSLTASGTSTFNWSSGISNGVTFTPSTTSTYTLTATDTSGCSDSTIVPVIVNPLPAIIANAAPQSVCQGHSTILTGGGAANYTWTGGVSNGVSFIPSSANTYTVTGTNANGCSNTSSISISILPNPTVTAQATPPTICQGASTILNGAGASSYTWTGGVLNNISFNPPASATYTVTGTAANGCTATSTQSVTVNPLPNVTANASPANVCSGNPTILSGGGALTYSWSGGVINGVSFVPAATTTYTVTGTNANSCTNTSSVTINVNPLPSVTANAAPPAVCQGSSTTLTGGGGFNFTWTGGISDGIPFIPASANTYTVTGTDANGCSNTSIISISILPNPVVTAQANPATLCLGSPSILNGNGASSYTWTGGVLNNTSFTPISSATYTVTGTAANGCTATATQSVIVNPLPNVAATANPPSVCEGMPTTLTGGGASTYTWSNSVINGVSFIPVSANTYTVTGVDANGCSSTSTVQVNITNGLLLTVTNTEPLLCLGDSTLLTATGGLIYQWSSSAGLSNTNGSPVWAYPSTATTYTVSASDINGCTGTATVFVDVIQGIDLSVSKSNDIECGVTNCQLAVSGAENYVWSPASFLSNPTGSITNSNISETTTFYVTGTRGTCVDMDSITVSVFNNEESTIFIPSAFSPNGDGLNDCFRVRQQANFTVYYFAIYNRWGQRVFESSNPADCWNGEFKNQKVQGGTYYYYLKAESRCGKIFRKGDILVVY